MTLTFDIEACFKVTATAFTQEPSVIEAAKAKGREYIIWTRILHVSLLWPYPLIKKVVSRSLYFNEPYWTSLNLKALNWVKYEPDWIKGIENMLQTSEVRWTYVRP